MADIAPRPWRWGDGWTPETFGELGVEFSGEKYADLRLIAADGSTVIPLGIDHYKFLFDAHHNANAITPEHREFIVRAVNAHDTLLEACDTARGAVFALVEMLTAEMTGDVDRDLRHLNCKALADVAKILTAALAKATGEPMPAEGEKR